MTLWDNVLGAIDPEFHHDLKILSFLTDTTIDFAVHTRIGSMLGASIDGLGDLDLICNHDRMHFSKDWDRGVTFNFSTGEIIFYSLSGGFIKGKEIPARNFLPRFPFYEEEDVNFLLMVHPCADILIDIANRELLFRKIMAGGEFDHT